MGLRVAALYDVHGNRPAFEAVLADVEREGVDVVLLGGDLLWGAWPQQTFERALSLGDRARFIRGNTDRETLDADEATSAWTRERLTPDQLERIRAWPLTLSLDVDGLGATLFCHATPRQDDEVVTPASPEARWTDVLAGVDEATVVCGHTHLQYDEWRAGHRVVNPGSVGNPTERATAWWALLGPGVELRATDYDTEATAAAWRATGFPRDDFAQELLEPVPWQRHLEWVESRA